MQWTHEVNILDILLSQSFANQDFKHNDDYRRGGGLTMAIPIKCLVSHCPLSRESGLVGRLKKRSEKILANK